MVYIYDEAGAPIGMLYRKTSYADGVFDRYLFEHDVFGNIISVYNIDTGAKVGSYCYDAWGNCTVLTNTNGIGAMNPFRYRGYYLDTETNLYYLQTRYYDSYVGRFINADGNITTGQGLTGNNMFAYCGNNPVNRIDPTGEFWITFLVAAVIVACTVALTSCTSQPEQSEPRNDLANAPDLDVNTASARSYNCYGNGIGKQINTNPTGYSTGDSTRKTFEAVKNDLGRNNVRELTSINDPIGNDEFKVALKCGPTDYHFIRLDNQGWYNKSGTMQGLYIDESVVASNIWYACYVYNGQIYTSLPFYDDETIYFAVKVGWDK